MRIDMTSVMNVVYIKIKHLPITRNYAWYRSDYASLRRELACLSSVTMLALSSNVVPQCSNYATDLYPGRLMLSRTRASEP